MGHIRLEEARGSEREPHRGPDRQSVEQARTESESDSVRFYARIRNEETEGRKATDKHTHTNTNTNTNTYTSTRSVGSTIQTGGNGGGMAVAVMMGREEESGGG